MTSELVINPFREAVDAVVAAGGEALKECFQCGLCTGTCPWNLLKSFSSRSLIHRAQLGLADFESEDTWTCATCGACVARCPRGVAIIDIMRALRNIVVEMGAGYFPESLRVTLKNIGGAGNPLGELPERRMDWATGLGVKQFTAGTAVLYFPCCVPAYDPSAKRLSQSMARLLKMAGVDYGVLGSLEVCCGESVRKAGAENLFQTLAQKNVQTFSEHGVRQVVAGSPHCFHTFRNEYPQLGGDFSVEHYTQYLLRLVRGGKLKLTKSLDIKVTYHDPCYLGRHNGVYEEPRELLRSIPGLELIEMEDYGPDSLCCGGGGGRIWEETKKGERLSDLRLDQALDTGASVLAIACPYCLLNFEDGVLGSAKYEGIKVKDIAELVLESASGE